MNKLRIFDRYKTPEDWKKKALEHRTAEKPKLKTWQFTTAVCAVAAVLICGITLPMSASNAARRTREETAASSDEEILSEKEAILERMRKEYVVVVEGIVVGNDDSSSQITVYVYPDESVSYFDNVITLSAQPTGTDYTHNEKRPLVGSSMDRTIGSEVALGFYSNTYSDYKDDIEMDSDISEKSAEKLREQIANSYTDYKMGILEGYANLGPTDDKLFGEVAEAASVIAETNDRNNSDWIDSVESFYMYSGYRLKEEITQSNVNISDVTARQLKTLVKSEAYGSGGFTNKYTYITEITCENKDISSMTANYNGGGYIELIFDGKMICYEIMTETDQPDEGLKVTDITYKPGKQKNKGYIITEVVYNPEYGIPPKGSTLINLDYDNATLDITLDYPEGFEIAPESNFEDVIVSKNGAEYRLVVDRYLENYDTETKEYKLCYSIFIGKEGEDPQNFRADDYFERGGLDNRRIIEEIGFDDDSFNIDMDFEGGNITELSLSRNDSVNLLTVTVVQKSSTYGVLSFYGTDCSPSESFATYSFS